MSFTYIYLGLTIERVLEIIPGSRIVPSNLPDGAVIFWKEEKVQETPFRPGDKGDRCVELWYGSDKDKSVLRVEKGCGPNAWNGQLEFSHRMKNAGIEDPWTD